MKTLQQIFAIARTEFRFGLRRGAPVVVTAVLGLILGAGILMNMGNNVQMADPHMEQYTPEQVDKLAKNGITAEVYRSLSQGEFADLTAIDTTQTWFFLYLALLFLPVATAGTLPADRQFDPALHDRTLADGLAVLAGEGITGKDVTPRLLEYFHSATHGESLRANVELVLANAFLAGEVAAALAGHTAGADAIRP